MFEHWSEFFLLLGSASGALIGLLFVVTTLAAGMRMNRNTLAQGAAAYMTPTLFHYTTVLVFSAVATAPAVPLTVLASLLAAWSLVGTVYCAVAAVLMRRNRLPDAGNWSDVFGYGILPAAMYFGLMLAAWSTWRGDASAPYSIAIGLVVLTVIGIRNAWDLVTFMAPRSTDDGSGPA